MGNDNFLDFVAAQDKSFELVQTDLQRTEAWFEQRRGNFTGSKIKDLMSCTRQSAKMLWSENAKIFDLGETAKKYIYSRAMERKHGYVVQTAASQAMKYGTRIEEQIFDAVKELFIDLKEVGYTPHPKYNFLGASPDGLAGEGVAELKAATTWDTLYSRHEILFDDKHQDFWQIQTEMLCAGKDKCIYAVALPPEDMQNDEIIKGVSIRIVDASPIHQHAILTRARLGNFIAERYLSGVDKYFSDSVNYGISEFEI
jgi:hypothetical protein